MIPHRAERGRGIRRGGRARAGRNATEVRFSVDFAYPVLFTRGVFDPGNPALRDRIARPGGPAPHRFLAFLDSGLAAAHPGLPDAIGAYARAHAETMAPAAEPVLVPGGERAKNDWDGFRRILDRIGRSGLCRHSYILAAGGGAVLDAVGLAASLVHRGLRLIRVPTTTLAQNDAGIGVKNGMNADGGKNSIGVFAPPAAVINDFDFLRTLDDRNWIAGAAEAFKVAILKDAGFFVRILDRAPRLRRRDSAAMEWLIRRCAALHLSHIAEEGDPFEAGEARPLDFGHWAAHRIESLSNYRALHGEAVSAGLALDSVYAGRMGWLADGECDAILRGLLDCGLPVWAPEFDLRDGSGTRRIYGGLESFREHLGGRLCVTFPDGIGRRREEHEIDLPVMDECIEALRRAGSEAVNPARD